MTTPHAKQIRGLVRSLCFATDVSYVDNLNAEDKAAFCAVFYRVVAEVLARRLRETSAELAQTKKEVEALKT